MALDKVVAEVVYLAKTLEKAVHDPGPWTMTWGGRTVPAVRHVGEDRVTFVGTFPEHCHLTEPDPKITLECDGYVVGVKAIIFPGDGAFDVQWSVRTQPAAILV